MTGARNKAFGPLPLMLLVFAAALVVTACGGTTEEAEPVDTSEFERLVQEAPPPLADLYSQASELVDAGPEGFEQTIADLEGFPIVVNVWASWCGPCRAEFPHLREAALTYGTEVAFLGLDSDDNEDAARTFLRDNPVPYPSYTDPDKRIAIDLGATFGLPATVYFDREGETAHVRHGVYPSEEDLVADLERYSLGPG